MKLAVVLFNLGGPDRREAVRPFLFNLFNDRAIIRLPQPFRTLIAWVIARRREAVARAIYEKIGGKSPLLPETRAQAEALQAALADLGEVRCFIAMRYWHPFAAETAAEVREFAPDQVVLLPLYPQFSTTTTDSSFTDWRQAARRAGLTQPESAIRSYPAEPGLIQAIADLIRRAFPDGPVPLVLFSAHGLPKRIVQAGDPYPDEVARTVEAVVAALGLGEGEWGICYQSRVGPLEWIGPSTDAEIRRAGQAGRALAVVPVAFVSEHSETLVELDMEYRQLAAESGVPSFCRIPTVGTHPLFIEGLARLVRAAL